MKYFGNRITNPRVVLSREKALVSRYYSFIESKISGDLLYCYGHYQPTTESSVYKYKIKYEPPRRPIVTVSTPEIQYNDDIHMYPHDRSLCLYHKTDIVWDTTYHLHDTIIPWTHEWFVFYELYKIKGEWLHPFVPHRAHEKV